MYPQNVPAARRLARAGLLDIHAIRTRSFPLEALPERDRGRSKSRRPRVIVVSRSEKRGARGQGGEAPMKILQSEVSALCK